MVFGVLGDVNLPSVTGGINGWEGDTAVEDLEEGLVLQHQVTCEAGRDGLGKSDDGIVSDDGATGETEAEGESRDGRRCEESKNECFKNGRHFSFLTLLASCNYN